MADSSKRPDAAPANGASFVDKLVQDPSKPPQALLLSGFTGGSSEAGHTRLYFDPELSDYVEIPNDAILHQQAMPLSQSPLGGSYIWVQRDAQLIHGPVTVGRRKASFLEGRLQREQFVNPRLPPPTAPIVCGDPTVAGCRPTTADVQCVVTTIGCHSIPGVNCPPQTSAQAGCQTIVGVNCPQPSSAAAGCHTIANVNCPNPTDTCPTSVHCQTQPLHCPTNIIPCQTKVPSQGCHVFSTSVHIACVAPAMAALPTHYSACAVTVLLQACPTHLPSCRPATAQVTACPGISVCAVCPPTHLQSGPCGFTHLPVQCPTHAAQCGPSGVVVCHVSSVGCPSNVVCNPQTIPGNPGLGLMGGFPG